ncbi:MAG: NUDIX hydrolase [Solibacillus sp.]|uniref:NUDIX hydrolase n=1 Tax=unclassified Solibacillus TaxID=2637870 RepID=UPI0030F8CE18
MNASNINNQKLLAFLRMKEHETKLYQPIAGSFAVVKCSGKYLLCYNTWRKQWEIPAGQRDGNETAKECAIRELYEETGQVVNDMNFVGLMKVKNNLNGCVKYNPIYFTEIVQLQSFLENDETSAIKLWDLTKNIRDIDEVDRHLLERLNRIEEVKNGALGSL